MGDIDRVSGVTKGRFLTDLNHHSRVVQKEESSQNPDQDQEAHQEHSDKVELHDLSEEPAPKQPGTKQKGTPKRLPTQQIHLDIEA